MGNRAIIIIYHLFVPRYLSFIPRLPDGAEGKMTSDWELQMTCACILHARLHSRYCMLLPLNLLPLSSKYYHYLFVPNLVVLNRTITTSDISFDIFPDRVRTVLSSLLVGRYYHSIV